MIARGSSADTILKIITPLEPIPANAILGKVKVTGKVLAESYETEMHQIIRGLVTKGGGPVISGIRLVGKLEDGEKKSNIEQTDAPAKLQTTGMALFREGKLVGWIGGSKARGLAWINNKIRSTVVNLDCGEQRNAVAVELLRAKTNITGKLEGGRPVIRLDVGQVAFVQEAMCSIDLGKSAVIRDLEQQLNEETKQVITSAVQYVQKLKTDVLGFGAAIERSQPGMWHRSVEKEWATLFPTAQVEITVNSSIRRTGMTSKPFLYKEKE
jgi:spore germination protein KC